MKLVVKKSAIKELVKIPKNRRAKIEGQISKLSHNPFPSQSRKLTGKPQYRLRVGDYRVLYVVNKREKIVEILGCLHRKDAYR